MVPPRQHPGRYAGLCRLLDQPPAASSGLPTPASPGFTRVFLRTSAGVWIVDLLGQGGIAVNDVAVRFSHLADGDLLKIGRYQIRVRCWIGRQSSGNRLPSRAGVKAFAQPRRGERLSNGLKPANWPAATIPFVAGNEPANVAQFPLAIPALPSHAKPELMMTSEATFSSLKLAPSESAESMLVPLVNHFGDIQQQMFDQFQQAMAMMLQMFGTMHREQMEVIRGELDRLHDLTEEFHSLKNELANRTQEGSRLAPNALPAASKGLDELMTTEPEYTGKIGGVRGRNHEAQDLLRQRPCRPVDPYHRRP